MKNNFPVMLVALLVLVPGLAAAQTEWVEYEGNPVIGPADPGAWDGGHRYVGTVINVEGSYHMYFFGNPDGYPFDEHLEIGHATSSDGLSWEMDPANPVMRLGAAGEWDEFTLSSPAVIHDGTGFRMWYTGGDGQVFRAGYATSPDGSSWTKYEDNPVIDVGSPGSFDDDWVGPGSVIVEDGLYRMWYTAARDVGPDSYDWTIGYAESTDGLSWTKHPEPVLDPGRLAWAPSVLFDGSSYHMWYGGAGAGVYISYAVSADGVEWARFPWNPVLQPVNQVSWPRVLYDEDQDHFEMWYTDQLDFSIHLATSGCCSWMGYLHMIPAAAFASGAEGSFFQTDVDVNNADDRMATYRFMWLPRGEDNSDPLTSDEFTLAAGMSVRYENVLAEVFGLEPDSLGALAIETDCPDLLLMSRTYNIADAKVAGTYGQMMPAIEISDMIPVPERRRLVFMTDDADYRANVGCQSGNPDNNVNVRVELFDHEGTMLGVENLMLEPWSNDQLNRVFGDNAPVRGYVDVWGYTGGGSYYCYGSVLDNQTSDPTTILPQ
jgi:predicted GH43/DUF377 family glycosyl hydrolase